MLRGLKQLPRKKLQDLVGEGLLRRLESLLPAVTDGKADTASLYNRQSLARVVDAFCGERLLCDPDRRRELLQHQPPKTIDRIISRTKIAEPEQTFEEKVSAIMHAGWSDDEISNAVLEELELSLANVGDKSRAMPAYEVIPRARIPFKTLKDFQYSVFLRAQQNLDIPRNRFIIQMPTGSGKTRTAMEIISHFLNQSADNAVVVWLAHSEELCEQAYLAFKEVWEHIGHHDAILARMWGQKGLTDFDFNQRAFVVAGFQKAYSLAGKKGSNLQSLRGRVGLIVADEAHKAIAPTYKAAIMNLCNDETKIVGLTATPGRSALDSAENIRLSRFFFGKITEIETPNEKNVISYLRNKKVLSDAEFSPLVTRRSFSLASDERSALETFFDFPAGFLKKVAGDDIRNVEIVKRLQFELDKGNQVLLFACSVDHSKFLCGCLTFLGLAAGHIDGNISRERRANIIDQFRVGELRVLSNYGVLSTGFDVPKLDVVFIARPTASIVLYSQMIGRGLRGPAIGGTETCRIIDVIDNIEGYSDSERVYDYFSEFWD